MLKRCVGGGGLQAAGLRGVGLSLSKEVMREPFSGIGKPEPLRHAFQGYWSRRIDSEHRLVYKVVGDQLWVAQVRFYYRD